MKRVLVTGATGFVGANLARRLLHDGHEVNLLVRPGWTPWRLMEIRHHVRLIEGNLGDRDWLGDAIARIRPDWIFHLAVHGAYSSQQDLHQIVATNIVGTVNLVDACLRSGFEAFVNTGSSSEYGFKDHPPHEREWLEPNSYYAVTKAAGTLFCRYTAQAHHVHLPTLRLYSVYGPYEEPTRLVPTLIVKGFDNTLPPLVDPEIARDYVYVADVVDAYLLAATSRHLPEPGAVFNVGTGTQTTLREIVDRTRRLLAIDSPPVWGSMPNRHWDSSVWVADNRALRQALGWQPRFDLDQGLRALAAWFRGNPALLEQYRASLRQRN